MASHLIVKATVDGVKDTNGVSYPKGIETIAKPSYYIRKLISMGELVVVKPKKKARKSTTSADSTTTEQ